MKNECNVVRDLMPLVIDGVASEESRALVTEHVWKCESCAGFYKDLQSQIAGGSDAAEVAAFARAAEDLKRLKKKRRAVVIAVTALVTALVLLVGNFAWDFLHTHGFPVRADSYNIRLVQLRNTNLVMPLYESMEHITGWSSYTENTDDVHRLIITAKAPLLGEKNHRWQSRSADYMLIDGKLYPRARGAVEAIDEIVQVGFGDTKKIVYQQGDAIPVGSKELTAYYAAYVAYHDWRSSTDAMYTDPDEIEQRGEELQVLYDLVPEFQ